MTRYNLIILCAIFCALAGSLRTGPVLAQGLITPGTEPSLQDTGVNKKSTVLEGSATVLDRSMSTNGQTTNPVGAPGSTASAGKFGNGARAVSPAANSK